MIQNKMLILLLLPVCVTVQDITAQQTVTLHFLHGSKPRKGMKHQESRWFGGKHGGHVYLQTDTQLFSFYPSGSLHVFASRKELHGSFYKEELSGWQTDTVGMRVTSITLPLTEVQAEALQYTIALYAVQSPYDYAVFGMRCASAAYDVLAKAGVVKRRGNFANICLHFYPQPLRRKLVRRAAKENYVVVRKAGRPTRKWEAD